MKINFNRSGETGSHYFNIILKAISVDGGGAGGEEDPNIRFVFVSGEAEKYEREAKKYWDIFYKRHKDKFFKDRHYLDKEWGRYFQVPEGEKLVVLEVGCGAGNTVFPLIATYPNIFCHACDFSPRAIDLVKAHKDFTGDQVNAFVCDLTQQDLKEILSPSSVDVVTMIFVLSAVSPEKMPSVLQNIKKILKPDGHVLVRDYATGDLAQERLTSKEQLISENFYVRGDGTRAYYFSNGFLTNLFKQNGFEADEVLVCNKQVENRSLNLVMNRRWVQAVFSIKSSSSLTLMSKCNLLGQNRKGHALNDVNSSKDRACDTEIDISESIITMFNSSPVNEVIEIKLKNSSFRIKVLGKEHQHTCKSTGLMLWESARFMCSVLAQNPSIAKGKRVLELGCGSAGVCSMVAIQSAELVVSTDGDPEALNLLKENFSTNLEPGLLDRILIKKLLWGNKEDIQDVKDLCGNFEVIIGTDVTYNPDAISPLFQTARELICVPRDGQIEPVLILSHLQRRVDEDSILSSASLYGFKLIDRWFNGMPPGSGIISSWFSQDFAFESGLRQPLTIFCFHI